MAAKSKGEFRQFPVSLIQQKRFAGLSPTAKATYFVLRVLLPSYGLGQLIIEALPAYVGCAEDAVRDALAELEEAEYLAADYDAGVYWLKGTESKCAWGSASFCTYYARTVFELPESELRVQFEQAVKGRGGTGVVPQLEEES